MELKQGDVVFLSGIDPEMTDEAFEALLIVPRQLVLEVDDHYC